MTLLNKITIIIVEKILAVKNDPVITKIIHLAGNSSASCDTLISNSIIDYKISSKILYDFILTPWQNNFLALILVFFSLIFETISLFLLKLFYVKLDF